MYVHIINSVSVCGSGNADGWRAAAARWLEVSRLRREQIRRPGEKSRLSERRLEAFAVDDGGAGLIVLLLADPHLLEGGQRGQDGAANPHGVLALRGRDDLERERRGQ